MILEQAEINPGLPEVIQWLKLLLPLQEAQSSIPGREQRSHTPRDATQT